MSNAKICDKCKKLITGMSLASGQWGTIDSGRHLKLNNQYFQVDVRLYLKCGDSFDLCRDCIWDVIHFFIDPVEVNKSSGASKKASKKKGRNR